MKDRFLQLTSPFNSRISRKDTMCGGMLWSKIDIIIIQLKNNYYYLYHIILEMFIYFFVLTIQGLLKLNKQIILT